jgi:hypothetical protein
MLSGDRKRKIARDIRGELRVRGSTQEYNAKRKG